MCKFCDSKACFYCLTDHSKKIFIQNLSIESQNNICKPTAVIVQPPNEVVTPMEFNVPNEDRQAEADALMQNEVVIKNFGKYLQ